MAACAVGRRPLVASTPELIVSSDLDRFLSRREFYGEDAEEVSVVETHISKVFLTGNLVYKLKKPVRFPFLDYSTLPRRQAACRDEVRLNNRLAPGIYLDIVPIVRGPDGEPQLGGEGIALDYCVKMKRLPADRMFDRIVRNGSATMEHIERLLDVLIPFYTHAARAATIDQHATASSIESNVRENLALFDSVGDILPRSMLHRVRASQLQFLKLSADVFDERIASSHVCEGHGDLRPEHVSMLPGGPIVFDCVEFSLPFRSADVISELAFLAMELEFLGASDLGSALLTRYRVRAGDNVPDSLVGFYKSYRACVRAKVELLRAGQESGAAAEQSRSRARRYLQLASFYATEFYRPQLFVMVGAAGTGKSTVADALADSLGLEVLRTDLIRHELAGRHEPDADFGQGIYSESMNSWTYETLFNRADALLREAVSVVLDGTFRSPQQRDRAIRLAHEHGAQVHLVYCQCPGEIARARIAGRISGGNGLSDARPEMYENQQEELAAADDLAALPVIIVDTAEPISAVVAGVVHNLRLSAARKRPESTS